MNNVTLDPELFSLSLENVREVYKNLLSEMKTTGFHHLLFDQCKNENVSENIDSCGFHKTNH